VGQKIFDCDEVLKLVDENKTGKVDASYPIFALVAIRKWYDQFFLGKKYKDNTFNQG
jgi:hypothetical protein